MLSLRLVPIRESKFELLGDMPLCCDTTRRARSALSCVSRGTGVSICETRRRLLTFTGLFSFHRSIVFSPVARPEKIRNRGFFFFSPRALREIYPTP